MIRKSISILGDIMKQDARKKVTPKIIEKMKQLKLIRKQEAVQKSEEKESGR